MRVAARCHVDRTRETRVCVKYGGAVDGVEFLNMQVEGIDVDQTAARDTEPVQPAHVAMAEDADFGPVRVASCSACAEVEVGRVGEVKAIDDFQVGEGIQSCGGVGVESAAVDSDDGAGSRVPPQ
jgi:hypothetical protein